MMARMMNRINAPQAWNPVAMINVSVYEPFQNRGIHERKGYAKPKSEQMADQRSG
jgi:hypothetical protein